MGGGSGCQIAYALSACFSAPNLSLQGPPRFSFFVPAHVSQHLCSPGECGSGEDGSKKGSACIGREGGEEA